MRILFATDGSACSEVARDLTASLAWPAASVVRLLTVLQPVHGTDDEHAGLQTAADELVAEAAGAFRADGLEIQRAVLRGRPASRIVEDAAEFGADLIVVGSRGHGVIGSMLLGSVAAEVLDHAHCPVLVGRRRAVTGVVLAHDGSDHAARAEEVVASWPMFRSVRTTVVSVATQTAPFQVPASISVEQDVPDYFAAVRELRERHRLIAAAAAARLARAGLTADDVMVDGDPAPAIMAVAEARAADLIVLGTHGRTRLQRLLTGSVARNVMQHAATSVLIVR